MGRKVKRKVLSSAKKRSSTDLMFLLSVRAQPKPAGSGSAPEAFPSGGARRSQEEPEGAMGSQHTLPRESRPWCAMRSN